MATAETRSERLAREALEAANLPEAESSAAGAAQGQVQGDTSEPRTLRSLLLDVIQREFEAFMYFHFNPASAEDLELAKTTLNEVKTIIAENRFVDLDKLHLAFRNKIGVILHGYEAAPGNDVFLADGVAAGLGVSWLPESYANHKRLELELDPPSPDLPSDGPPLLQRAPFFSDSK